MLPTTFPQSNAVFTAPADLDKTQCADIHACKGKVVGGTLDGANFVITAWKPDARELGLLNAGQPVFLTCIGGLPPHHLSVTFEEASNNG